jgi:hypothetical protein
VNKNLAEKLFDIQMGKVRAEISNFNLLEIP